MNNYYFTFGSSLLFPFQNAYIIIQACDRSSARKKFRTIFPDRTPGFMNYSFDYTESEFKKTSMYKNQKCKGVY